MPLQVLGGIVIGAAAASPEVRKVVRKGLIFAVGGALVALDKLTAMAKGAVESARDVVESAAAAAGPTPANGQTPAPPVRPATPV